MTDIEQAILQFPQAIVPVYTTTATNDELPLYRGQFRLRLADGKIHGSSGRIYLKWLPSPEITFEMEEVENLYDLPDADLDLPALNRSFAVAVTRSTLPKGPCSGRVRHEHPGPSPLVSRLLFHLPNFLPFLGGPVRNEQRVWRGRLCLTWQDWEIDLDELPEAEHLRARFEADGGFAITHVGELRRQGDSCFDPLQAKDILDALFYFFSFCRTQWCGPLLFVGFDPTGSLSWEWWHVPRNRSWKTVRSWFPTLDPSLVKSLNHAFQGFLAKWTDSLWNQPLRNAIHWFVEANSNAGGVEGSLVLAQTALELLGWLYLVEDPNTSKMGAKKFNSEAASTRIALLLNELCVPRAMPSSLPKLAGACPAQRWQDGPSALVGIRNSLVHSKRSKRQALLQIGTQARIEGWMLSVWYLELTLLHLVGYRGIYYSRLKSGFPEAVQETVPWV